jgi:LysM repeat protein
MERICPFLALEGDARTVVAGFDPEHRCRAVSPAIVLERAQQLSVCLEPAHRGCPRYVAAVGARDMPRQLMPAADAMLGSTRLVLEPEASARLLRRAGGPGPSARRWAMGGLLAVVGAVAVAGGVTGALGSLPSVGSPSATQDGSQAARQSASPRPAAVAASTEPATPTPAAATPSPATPTPAAVTPQPTPPPTQAPEQRSYVVQPGDTLHAIAVQFGTTVDALQRANGLADSDLIVVGQRLVIP